MPASLTKSVTGQTLSANFLGPFTAMIAFQERVGGKKWYLRDGGNASWLQYLEACHNNSRLVPDWELEILLCNDVATFQHFRRQYGLSRIGSGVFTPENQLGMASVSNFNVKWKQPGKKIEIAGNPAVELREGVSCFLQGDAQVACIETQSGDTLWMAQAMSILALSSRVGLLEKAIHISTGNKRATSYDGVRFPMIDFEQSYEADCLSALCLKDSDTQEWSIAQAHQKDSFRMDHLGASAKSGSSMIVDALGVDEFMVFDKPFLLWIVRPGIRIPLFVARFGRDVWMNPRRLYRKLPRFLQWF